MKSAAAANQAHIAVAYSLAARQEQAAAGVPAHGLGGGVDEEIAADTGTLAGLEAAPSSRASGRLPIGGPHRL